MRPFMLRNLDNESDGGNIVIPSSALSGAGIGFAGVLIGAGLLFLAYRLTGGQSLLGGGLLGGGNGNSNSSSSRTRVTLITRDDNGRITEIMER